mgnify:CR=1 FL=1
MILRSIIFYIFLSVWTIFMGIICLPFLFISMIYIHKPINLWILGIFKLLETTCNITHEVKGMENIPEYSILVASKHQSAFETFALFFYINKSIFIHKKQLFFIPIFGQYLKKTNMISINRSEGIASMRKMIKKAKSKMSAGYSIIIFPEGTRKIPGDKPDYKTGFIGIYNETESEILPVAVNSGCCWPKHTFVKTPGKIIIKILNPIPANLKKDEILKKVESVIEEETNKII